MEQQRFSFLMDGRDYRLNCLSLELDRAFMHLYEAFAGPKPFDLRVFQKAALQFFDQNQNSWDSHDRFFQNFTILWNQHREGGRFLEAEAVWDLALRVAFDWENINPSLFIHKGSPFYFWGMTAILNGDIDKGYSLMHRAVKEDERSDPQNYRQKPGFYFITLDYTRADQAFRHWLLAQADFLNRHVQVYNSKHHRSFTLSSFQTRFLSASPTIETVSLLGYVIARLMRLKLIPLFALESAFSSQIEGNLLFDLVCVIDDSIRAKNPKSSWKFIDHAEHLSTCRNGLLTKFRLQNLNERLGKDFDAVMTDLVEGRYVTGDGMLLDQLDSCIAVTYGIRNKWAHGVPSATIIWKRFEEMKQRALDTLFLTAEFLY